MKINDKQLANFKKLCKENCEFIPFFDDEQLKRNIESAMIIQGYWSGMAYRYYLDGDEWRNELRVFGTN